MSSNYPNGFLDGVTIRGLPLQQLHPGEVFWVNNSSVLAPVKSAKSGSDGNNGSYKEPFGTVDFAIGKCKAGRGDVIVVMPGHAETLGAADAISSDVAGVAIVGLGAGSLRPTFSYSAAASTWELTVANCSFYNLVHTATVADVVTAFNFSGAADNTTMEYCEWNEGVDLNFIDCIVALTGCDQLEFNYCKWLGLDAFNDSFFSGVAHVGFRMEGCYIYGDTAQDTSPSGQVDASGNVTDVWIKDCVFVSKTDGALQVDFNGSACSGIILDTQFASADTAGAITT